jgi:hypothetical protein
MKKLDKIVEILDTAVQGVGHIGPHGPFWRNKTRDQFVGLVIFGVKVVILNNAEDSGLVKALEGRVPFGADLPDAPPDATFPRMPGGLPPVPGDSIQFIRQWIDSGCPDEEV